MSFGSAETIRRRLAPLLLPPSREPMSEWSERNPVWVKTPGGYDGPWKTPSYMRRPMDCLTDRNYKTIAFIGPAQSGKTFGLVECTIAYNAFNVRANVAVIQMTQPAARDFSNDRLTLLHRYTPGLQDLVQKKNTHDIYYKAGHRLYIGWPAVSQLSSKSLQFVLLTDYDRFPDDIDGEGNAWGLSLNRIKTFLSRGCVIAEASPGREPIDPKAKPKSDHHYPLCEGLVSLYHAGTMERWYWPCPECEDYFQCKPSMDLDYLYIPNCGSDIVAAAEQSRIICKNGCMVNLHEHKVEMNERGIWVGHGQSVNRHGELEGDPINTDVVSFGMSGWGAEFQSPKDLALQIIKAKNNFEETGEENELKTTVTTQLGAPFRTDRYDSEVDNHALSERAADFSRSVIPEGVRYTMTIIDVQGGKDRRFVVQTIGYGKNLESWLIDRYSIRHRDPTDRNSERIDPAVNVEDWNVLKEYIFAKEYPLADGSGRYMKNFKVVVDIGGEPGVTDKAYKFYRSLDRKDRQMFMLVKGEHSRAGYRVKESWPDNTKKKNRHADARGDVPIYLVNTTHVKDMLNKSLERIKPGPGYFHFPKWLKNWFYEELTVEIRTPNGWQRPSTKKPNEAIDCYCYGYAVNVSEKVRADKIKWEGGVIPPWARDWDENSLVFDPSIEDELEPLPVERKPRERRTRGVRRCR